MAKGQVSASVEAISMHEWSVCNLSLHAVVHFCPRALMDGCTSVYMREWMVEPCEWMVEPQSIHVRKWRVASQSLQGKERVALYTCAVRN